jgi:hypothetical protein
MELPIEESFPYRVDSFWLMTKYYGTYGDSVVLNIMSQFVYSIFVGGQVFPFGSHIYVWRAGEFYTLREAYNSGLFTEEDIRDIAYYNNLGVIDINIRDDGFYINHVGIPIPLWVGNLNELKEFHISGLFSVAALRSIAKNSGLNYDDLFGGK